MDNSAIKLAVIGYPVTYSLSPLLHNHWIAERGILAQYEMLKISKGTLKQAIPKLIAKGYRGFNITIPYKQDIMNFCERIDDTARHIGAVNTVLIKDGKLYGSNTDTFGFTESLKQSGASFAKNHALVLGAGGAARAVTYGLKQMGFKKITIVNRTLEKAQEMAQDFGVEFNTWEHREIAAKNVDVVVNTTSLGMTGQTALEFDVRQLPGHCVVCDIVYKPLYTKLLSDARDRGLQTVTGLGMLVHQARLSFLNWFDIMPDDSDVLQHKLQHEIEEHAKKAAAKNVEGAA